MTLSVDHLHHLDRRPPGSGDANREMALWVPSERVSVHLIDAPTAPQRKWPELIPWILEDRLLQPVDEMHFVIGQTVAGQAGNSLENDGSKQVAVSVVSKQDLREWLRIAENATVDARAMVPDYLALPFEPGRISMAWHEGKFLVRTASDRGFAATADLAWLMVRRLLDSADIAPRLSISTPDVSLIPDDLRDAADINSAETDWQFAAMPMSANLLTGEFKPASADLASQSWLSTAALLLLTVVLGFGYLQLSNAQLETRIAELESEASAGFGNVFPGQRARPDDVRRSGEQLLADLFRQRESLQGPVMKALSGLDAVLTNCDCRLQTLVANESGLSLTVKNASNIKSQSLNLPGFAFERKESGEQTAISLRRVAQR